MENNKICRLRQIYLAVGEFENSIIKNFGLNYNELSLLATLNTADCLTASELAEKLGLSASCTSKVIGSVEKKELILRALCKEDKRMMRFCLTEAGKKKIASVDCSQVEVPGILKCFIDDKCPLRIGIES
ncbi:MAG: MarR family transcriptional regulator [Bacteroidales bacterium]|nr:MarR family transcriptional regulator [Bacteroidales bacterium]